MRRGSAASSQAAAVGGSVTAVVLWGTVVGAMLPLLLRSGLFGVPICIHIQIVIGSTVW
jgi:hypothetical protein